jgi:hypothetical protein
MRGMSRVVGLLVFAGNAIAAALQALDSTLPTLIPVDIRNNPRFQSVVLAELLEAVEGGKLVNLGEYQDGVGCLQGVRMTPSHRQLVLAFCATPYELERGL